MLNLKLFFIILIGFTNYCKSENQGIYLDNINYIQLNKNTLTVGNRFGNYRVPQLNCHSNLDLCEKYTPESVICTNLNYGVKPGANWQCQSSFKDNIKFNNYNVICIPFNRDNWDPNYVVKGSCYLRFSLRLPNDDKTIISNNYKDINIYLIIFIIILLIISLVLSIDLYLKRKKIQLLYQTREKVIHGHPLPYAKKDNHIV